MKQDGDNRVGLIKSETAKKVSQKLAEASAARPAIVGAALNEIAEKDQEILDSVIEVMETEQLIASGARVDIVADGSSLLVQLDGDSRPRDR